MQILKQQNLSARHQAGVFANLDSIRLKAAPIQPSWIVSGRPDARSGSHSGGDGSSTNVWECTSGVFQWTFGWEETVLILDGSVKVTSPDGKTSTLNVGDVGYFPAGGTWIWEVETYVRKLAFCHRPPSRSERIVRAARAKFNSHATAIKLGLGLAAAAMAVIAID